jgi:hypothetical protein
MYHQLELARSGDASFKINGKYLKYLGILAIAVACFNGAMGPFSGDVANLVWFCAAFAVAVGIAMLSGSWVFGSLAYSVNCGLRYFTRACDSIS